MNRQSGFRKGKELAIREYQKNGYLSLDSKSLIHFANGMCHYSVWFEQDKSKSVNKYSKCSDVDSVDSIDEFIQGFIDGYKEMIEKYDFQRGFLQFYFKS